MFVAWAHWTYCGFGLVSLLFGKICRSATSFSGNHDPPIEEIIPANFVKGHTQTSSIRIDSHLHLSFSESLFRLTVHWFRLSKFFFHVLMFRKTVGHRGSTPRIYRTLKPYTRTRTPLSAKRPDLGCSLPGLARFTWSTLKTVSLRKPLNDRQPQRTDSLRFGSEGPCSLKRLTLGFRPVI